MWHELCSLWLPEKIISESRIPVRIPFTLNPYNRTFFCCKVTKSRSHGDIHRGGNIWNRVRNRLNNMVKFTPKSKQYTFKEDRSRAKNEDEHFRPVKYSLGNVATPIVSITHQLLEPVVLPSNSLFLQSGSTIQFTDNNLLVSFTQLRETHWEI